MILCTRRAVWACPPCAASHHCHAARPRTRTAACGSECESLVSCVCVCARARAFCMFVCACVRERASHWHGCHWLLRATLPGAPGWFFFMFLCGNPPHPAAFAAAAALGIRGGAPAPASNGRRAVMMHMHVYSRYARIALRFAAAAAQGVVVDYPAAHIPHPHIGHPAHFVLRRFRFGPASSFPYILGSRPRWWWWSLPGGQARARAREPNARLPCHVGGST